MSDKKDNLTLYVTYQPSDRKTVRQITAQIKHKYLYEHEIVTVPLVNSIDDRNFLIIEDVVIPTKAVLANLLNAIDMIPDTSGSSDKQYTYPLHSIFMIEYDHNLNEVTRVVWASNKYMDDIGTFASRKMRHQELERALAELHAADDLKLKKMN